MNWNEIFTYREGYIYWKISTARCIRVGDIANCMGSNGYLRVNVYKRSYPVHRIIYEMHNGAIEPEMQIDHLDGNPLNNEINNLRAVPVNINQRNRKLSCVNTSGVVGVCFNKRKRKWKAYIFREHLGWYKDFVSACEARIVAEVSTGGFHTRHGT